MPIGFYQLYADFQATMAKLSSCDYIVNKPKIFIISSL